MAAKEERLYTLEQIKQAFWNTFHKSGEIWFGYLGSEEDDNECTQEQWGEFKESLDNLEQ